MKHFRFANVTELSIDLLLHEYANFSYLLATTKSAKNAKQYGDYLVELEAEIKSRMK